MKVCDFCKVQYKENRSHQRFCSPRCQNKNWVKEHPRKTTEYDRLKYLKNKKTIIERTKKWAKEHPEKLKIYYKTRRLNHPEEVRLSQIARTKKWQKANPLKVRAFKLSRRCMLAGNGGKYTSEEWQVLLDKSKGFCLKCRQPVGIKKLTVDHIIPVSLGGSNFIGNLQPLCHSCNAKKHTNIERFDYI